MNFIGIFTPKIIALLIIWIPGYALSAKLLLTAICFCKLLLDMDVCRPGKSGKLYKMTASLSVELQEAIANFAGLCVSLLFGMTAFWNSAWIPAVLGFVLAAGYALGVATIMIDARKQKKAAPTFAEYRIPQSGATQPPVPPVSPVPVMPAGAVPAVMNPPRTRVSLAKLQESFKQEESKYYKKRFSILGDSISTLDGFHPDGFRVFYTGENCAKASVSEYSHTWWGQVIDFFGGELLVNNSWSGSRVSVLPNGTKENMFPSGCSKERTGGLHRGTDQPDVILVYLGFNDWANGIIIDDPFDDRLLPEDPTEDLRCFGSAYNHMLYCIRINYPDAEIWCCTLGTTRMSSNPEFAFPNSVGGIDIQRYNDCIKEMARCYCCNVVDLFDYQTPYDTVDGSHPNAEGMKTIAELVIREIGGQEMEIMKDRHDQQQMKEQIEYVDSDPDATSELFSDGIELFRESNRQTVTAHDAIVRVGRSEDCDIVVDDPCVSRYHATFSFEKGGWYVQDQDSVNKTFLNEISIEPGKKYRLHTGDILTIGPEKFCFFKSRMFPKQPKPVGNFAEAALAILESAIKDFVESDFKNDMAFKLMITALSDVPLYVPVQVDMAAMLSDLDPEKLKPGDTIKPEKDVKIKVLTLDIGDGGEIIPLFTSMEEVNKGQSVSAMRYYPQDYLPLLLKMGKHVVINPFSDHKVVLTIEMIKSLLKPVVDNKVNPVIVPPVPPVSVPKPVPSVKKDTGDEHIGKLIDGKYRILSLVGKGGMSKTYLAINERANKQWAVKVIEKKTGPLVEYARQETRMIMNLDHPAIPRVSDVVEDNQCVYIVEEYVPGEPMNAIIERIGVIPVDAAICWAVTLCDVLTYLHTRQPAHIYRDMKPANIIVHPDWVQLKLIDFGTMRLYDPKKTQDTTILGTNGYAPPEQFGGAGQTDARADIFALGMTLYHMVTGRHPAQVPYQPIRQVNPNLPADLEAIINKCVEPDPDKRFQTAEDVKKALQGDMSFLRKKSLWKKLFNGV